VRFVSFVAPDGGMAARAPRDTDRPVRRAARGIAFNGSDPSVELWDRIVVGLMNGWMVSRGVACAECPARTP
jgi:hypothetical protein